MKPPVKQKNDFFLKTACFSFNSGLLCLCGDKRIRRGGSAAACKQPQKPSSPLRIQRVCLYVGMILFAGALFWPKCVFEFCFCSWEWVCAPPGSYVALIRWVIKRLSTKMTHIFTFSSHSPSVLSIISRRPPPALPPVPHSYF